jgi:putative ABC transport system substrate-binding protein
MFGASFIAWPSAIGAQQRAKIHRIGFLRGAAPLPHYLAAFQERLKELGYVEGRNLELEYRWGSPEQLPGAAAELVRRGVSVIVTDGTFATLQAKNATGTIPIVMRESGDPVGAGLVASLSRPGGNITGLTALGPALATKRLELLTEIIPGIARVALLRPVNSPNDDLLLEHTQPAARALGVQLISIEVRGPDDYNNAFQAVIKHGAKAVLLGGTSRMSLADRKQFVQVAAASRMPVLYGGGEWVELGGLMSYGPNPRDSWRRTADFVDKILKGAKPADLPIEQPSKFELLVNRKTAAALGLTVPEKLLLRADKVVG